MIECKTSKEIIFIGNNINPSLTIDGGRILGLKGIYVISENCTVEVNGGYIQPTIYGDDITVTINGGFLGAGISSNKSSGSATGIVNGGYVKFNGFGSLYYKNEADVELKNYIFSLRDANNTGVYSTVVTGLTTDPSLDYEYGLNDVRTDDYGELHIWLPEGKTWASVTAGGQTFSGEITYVDKYYSATLRLPSLNPAASITTAAKGNASSTSVDFTLTSAPTGTWKVYESADATEVMAGVTATLSGTTLTLASSEDPIEIGDYYVTVTEPNKNESERLKLTVEFVAPSPAKAITAFNFNEVTPNVIGTINEVDKTISLAVPYGTNVTNLVPTIIHTGASVSPNSGVAQDFTSPVTYTVTAEDDTTQTYTVTVTVAPAPGGGSGGSGSSGGGSGGSTPTTPTPTPAPQPAITVTEVKSELFSNTEDIVAEADVETAFGQPVEVKITDDEESQNEVFQLVGADDEVYPFDISLYSKVSGEKVQPKEGHNVRITLPVPEKLLDVKDKVKVVYVRDGKLEILASQLIEKDGKWYITFEAVHFSPYALIVNKEPPVSWTNPFSDVKEGSWYYSAVQYVAQNGLMFGTGSDTFSPQLTTNRAMIATILYRLSGSTEIFQSTFKDVVPGAYYTQGVAWAQEKGIIAGYGNGMFGPEDTITREQMAAILWRYAGSPKADTAVLNDFNDAGDISDYARQAMVWVYEEGIIAGKGSRILDPRGLATRAEAAMILTNYLKAK